VYPRRIAVFGFYNDRVVAAARHEAAEEMRQLRPFWCDGRMLRWPAREGRRRLLLAEVVQAFPRGRRFREIEVDTILRAIWPDHCQLRRALVDYEFLNRKNGIYWRIS
jgi:hypothetical protein